MKKNKTIYISVQNENGKASFNINNECELILFMPPDIGKKRGIIVFDIKEDKK